MITISAALSSLVANPHRSLLGLVAVCTALAPLVVDAPGAAKVLHAVAVVAGALAALVPSNDPPADAPTGAQ